MSKNKLTLEQERKYADNLSKKMRNKIEADLLSFTDTDVLLFRAEYPQGLRTRQEEQWGTVLDWFKNVYGVMPDVTLQILPIKQSEQFIQVFKNEFAKMNGRELIVFAKIAGIFTSLILALAVVKNHLSVEDAFTLSRLEEIFQNETWGTDKQAMLVRDAALDEAKNVMRIIND